MRPDDFVHVASANRDPTSVFFTGKLLQLVESIQQQPFPEWNEIRDSIQLNNDIKFNTESLRREKINKKYVTERDEWRKINGYPAIIENLSFSENPSLPLPFPIISDAPEIPLNLPDTAQLSTSIDTLDVNVGATEKESMEIETSPILPPETVAVDTSGKYTPSRPTTPTRTRKRDHSPIMSPPGIPKKSGRSSSKEGISRSWHADARFFASANANQALGEFDNLLKKSHDLERFVDRLIFIIVETRDKAHRRYLTHLFCENLPLSGVKCFVKGIMHAQLVQQNYVLSLNILGFNGLGGEVMLDQLTWTNDPETYLKD